MGEKPERVLLDGFHRQPASCLMVSIVLLDGFPKTSVLS